MTDAKLQFDALTTAKRALRAKVPGAVPLKLSHSRLAVRAWVAAVAEKVLQTPRDATVKITLRHIYRKRAKHGRALDQTQVAADVDAALDDGVNAPRRLHTRLKKSRRRSTPTTSRACTARSSRSTRRTSSCACSSG